MTVRGRRHHRCRRQPTFHPFAITSRLAAGQVLRVETLSPTVDIAKFGAVPSVDAVATYDEESGRLAVVCRNSSTASSATRSSRCVNRSVESPVDVTLDTSRTPVTSILSLSTR
ncbi:MAG TPA: hypothetical protein VFT31_06660 [Kribbella sp.]|nr:hypothetical protein [Kribbella sp.]